MRGGRGRGFSTSGAPRGREFDRVSGTGRGKEVSKEGAGGHNWGSATEEARTAEAGNGEAVAENAEGEADAAVEEVAEEIDTTLTFDEYQKQIAAKRAGKLFEAVKEDTSALKKQFEGAKFKKVRLQIRSKPKGACVPACWCPRPHFLPPFCWIFIAY